MEATTTTNTKGGDVYKRQASEANGPEAMEAMNDFIETRSAMCRPCLLYTS